MEAEKIYDIVSDTYTIVHVTTAEHLHAVKEIRKEVFSRKYKLPPAYLEAKGYFYNIDDERSFIYLIQHRPTARYIGTVRMCFINNHTPQKELPLQKDAHVDDIDHLLYQLPVGEISRLALSYHLPQESCSALQHRTALAVLLTVATRINMLLYPYKRIFAIMEPSLERILRRQNIRFEQIAEAVDYYGMRTPYAVERDKLLYDTEETLGALTRFYLREMCEDTDALLRFIRRNPYLRIEETALLPLCDAIRRDPNTPLFKLLHLLPDRSPHTVAVHKAD